MTLTTRPATFSVSIDVAAGTAVHGDSERAALTILEQLGSVALPATWAVDQFAPDGMIRQIVAARPEHELAVLADASWASSSAGRPAYSRELATRLMRARSHGWQITTLALPRGCEIQHIDLTIKQGITALRTHDEAKHGRGRSRWFSQRPTSPALKRPRTVHYGLWEVAVSQRFAPERAWFGVVAAAQVRADLDRAIAAGGHYHLLIDAAEFALAGRRGEKALSRVIRHVDRRRHQGALQVANISGSVACLMPARESSPARSILRRMAA